MALTKELVELHHGIISVESQHGRWTEFKIAFPLGRKHLNDEEIVDEPETDQTEDVILSSTLSGTKNPVTESEESIDIENYR